MHTQTTAHQLPLILGLFCVTSVQGMVDPGELVSDTLKREFAEEALNSEEASEANVRNSYLQSVRASDCCMTARQDRGFPGPPLCQRS